MVVTVQDDFVVDAPTIRPRVLEEMFDSALRMLGRAKNASQAWRKFLKPEDVVGIKFNPYGERALDSSEPLASVIVNSLIQSGWPVRNKGVRIMRTKTQWVVVLMMVGGMAWGVVALDDMGKELEAERRRCTADPVCAEERAKAKAARAKADEERAKANEERELAEGRARYLRELAEAEERKKERKEAAPDLVYLCWRAVKARAKFPSEVDFPWGGVTRNDSGYVSGLAHMMNGLGMKVPTKYSCEFDGGSLLTVQVGEGQ